MKQAKTLLVISQVYVPDPAAVGQYMADVAVALVKRGWSVRVLTSSRGFDNPKLNYPKREEHDGVMVRRLPFSSFGKSYIFLRLIAGFCFTLQVFINGLFIKKLGAILVSTSPPIGTMAAIALGRLRKVPINYWVMDINPDQMIKLNRISERSIFSRLFGRLNKSILNCSESIITLDEYMAKSLNTKVDVKHKLRVIPPWPLVHASALTDYKENPFRKKHALTDHFIFMYSGNHSIANP